MSVDPTRIRCPVCGRYPSLTKDGRLRDHSDGDWEQPTHCPGSGQVINPPNQLTLEQPPTA